MKFYFTSDCHFGHDKIREYSNRPFKSLKEMDTTLIRNWNARVKPEDTVFHIGDFCFKNSPNAVARGEGGIKSPQSCEKMLNGKIIFIKGNHDGHNNVKTPITRMTIVYGGKTILLIHDPMDIVNIGNHNLVFCGHVHTDWETNKIGGIDVINVGVDVNKFRPVSLEELLKKVRTVRTKS
jgi:calcineurin-like phosphoesterase family protein